jgi:hypothetical protein
MVTTATVKFPSWFFGFWHSCSIFRHFIFPCFLGKRLVLEFSNSCPYPYCFRLFQPMRVHSLRSIRMGPNVPNPWLLATPVFALAFFLSRCSRDTVLKFKCFFGIDAAGPRA